ncbi:MAG: FHA domain-containing protein [Xanthomonadales bacterium]|nr:FHA domain-containing protein [Gammaproteobacteria bacterium]NNJ79765.1 FHA domain-containing protein [Xanthomonadales bacterium]MBT8051801.1 FHA domain-containing protein [Gammaproteobacteria bacterium]MBT8064630.1 FHA domain-containing protein [Gammaproteobacteria bacterium]NNK38139.1 FHA domain-containing protein [Xanthomonadales bacterium]
MNEKDSKRIGRATGCELRLEHDSVSRLHASVEVTEEGYLAVFDNDSSNGSFLHRNGRWVRVKRVVLGTQDRIRFGEEEVVLDRLVDLFDQRSRVRLREGYDVRGKPLVFESFTGEAARPRVVLENPRRNPLTGDIEEFKQD